MGVVTLGLHGLPNLELWGIAERIGERPERRDRRFYLVPFHKRFYQLAMVRAVGRYWFSFRSPAELPHRIRTLRRYVLSFPSFAVEGEMEREVGWWLDGRVDLKKPAQLIYVHRGEKYHVLSDVKVIRGKDFRARDAKHRPFFHPSSMNAREARMLVNAGGVMPGDIVLDPFCGAGGILIEAGLVGARVVGVDIDEHMVEGCKKNLTFFGIKGEVFRGDARKVDVEADIVITDPPYGRSTKADNNLRRLYLDALENLHTIVKKRLVIVFPFEGEALLERAGFKVLRKARWYVHSSLTRRVYVCSP